MEMDKSWMMLNRSSMEYRSGVEEFLDFAFTNVSSNGKVLCPCRKCVNKYWKSRSIVHEHLICEGFLPNYTNWFCHGESVSASLPPKEPNVRHQNGENPYVHDLHGLVQELFGMNNEEDMTNMDDVCEEETTHQLDDETQNFYNFVKDANQELYSGSKNYSKLGFIVHLFHIKCLGGWSDKSWTMLLECLTQAFPLGDSFPKSTYQTKAYLRKLGLGYEKIHACPNDCMLFWKDTEDESTYQSCLKCGKSRWKIGETDEATLSNKKKKIPAKVMRYFPLKPRLQRLYMSTKTADSMRWHAEKRVKDGLLRHPADSHAWKSFDSRYREFSLEPRNVRMVSLNKLRKRSLKDINDSNKVHEEEEQRIGSPNMEFTSDQVDTIGFEEELEDEMFPHASGKRKGRGPSVLSNVWNLSKDDRIIVECNAEGQPIAMEGGLLGRFLGTMARNGSLTPLDYTDWRSMPDSYKKEMVEITKTKFHFDNAHESHVNSWILTSVNTKWRNHKSDLKAKYYQPHKSMEEMLANLPEDVNVDQWKALVKHWESEKAQLISKKNQENRSHHGAPHTAGQKSFARLRNEEEKKRGKEVDRADLYIITHQHKDERPLDDKSQHAIERIKAKQLEAADNPNNSGGKVAWEGDIYSQVLGNDRHGRVRGIGIGPTPSRLWGSKKSRVGDGRFSAEDQRREEEICQLRTQVQILQGQANKVQAMEGEMAELRSTIQLMIPQLTKNKNPRVHDRSPLSDINANTSALPKKQHSSFGRSALAKKKHSSSGRQHVTQGSRAHNAEV